MSVLEKYKDKITHVTLSIDGATAEAHDALRRRKGAFDKVVASATRYIELGYKVRISTSLNKKNKHEVEGLLELVRNLGASGVRFGGTIPTAWNRNLVLDDDESLELYQKITVLNKSPCLNVQTISSLYTRGGVNFFHNLSFNELVFNSLGEMIFCCDTIANGAGIGSLFDHSMTELVELWLEKSKALQMERAKQIAAGAMGEKFDTCAFCNQYFS
jgi:MoaA/NifB/PqqE/SkfB family radical SAM enzyme